VVPEVVAQELLMLMVTQVLQIQAAAVVELVALREVLPAIPRTEATAAPVLSSSRFQTPLALNSPVA
jgi:hypothetical protein